MLGRDFFARSDEVFVTLFNLANEELNFNGIKIEPSVIVDEIISPLKDLYLKNLTELLESLLKKNS
jgi:hypothetical protein